MLELGIYFFIVYISIFGILLAATNLMYIIFSFMLNKRNGNSLNFWQFLKSWNN